ncbi:MAG TPA: Gfo/Idh/MocA family oxidoreductase [Clostridia bacterium]
MTSESKILNIGVLGCSQIVPRSIINPLKGVGCISAYGIASRHSENAVTYSEKYNIPNVFESYEDLLASNEIDFVYIALPNHLHKDWVIKAAYAGKHIMVEKPLCITLKELDEMKEACLKRNVHLLEGLMVQHHPWQEYIKEAIFDRRYGKLINTNTQISFIPKDNFSGNYRSRPEYGGGTFYDLASYWIQFLQCIGDINSADYDGNSDFKGPNGCDWTFHGHLNFYDGCHSNFTASFEMPYTAKHEMRFEKAVLTVEDFFRANLGNYKINITIEELNEGATHKVSFPPQCYYTNQLLFFYDVITGQRTNIDIEESYERQALMENIYCKARAKIK